MPLWAKITVFSILVLGPVVFVGGFSVIDWIGFIILSICIWFYEKVQKMLEPIIGKASKD